MKTCSMRCKHIVLGARQARIVLIKKRKQKILCINNTALFYSLQKSLQISLHRSHDKTPETARMI